MTPRGIRNNNPGNIRKSKDDWQGLAADQPDGAFFTFESPVAGIRALAKILLNYQRKKGLHTIHDIISRWAPPSENDTAAYIAQVAKHVGCAPEAMLTLSDRTTLFLLVEAIIQHENGTQPYDAKTIHAALTAAGVSTP